MNFNGCVTSNKNLTTVDFSILGLARFIRCSQQQEAICENKWKQDLLDVQFQSTIMKLIERPQSAMVMVRAHASERERGRHATYRNLDVGREEAVWRSRHRGRSEEEVGRFFCFVVCRVLLIEQL